MGEIWSVVPPIVAVVVALTTKRVLFALFISVWVGGIIKCGGNPLEAVAISFDWIKDVMTDEWNSRFLVLIALLGSGAAFMFKTGGSLAITKALEKKLQTAKRAQMFAWVLGIVVFFNDYVNSVIVGNATRDITARHNVSREKLSYVLDATAAPMATIGPVSDWIGYQVSLIAAAFAAISLVDAKPYISFLYSIPWNFYCLLSLAAVPMVILGKDFGPMAKAELRARKTGKLIAEGDTPLSNVEVDIGEPYAPEKAKVIHFILPLTVLIVVSVWGLWFTGGGLEGKSIMTVLADAAVDKALTWGAFAMTITSLLLAIQQKVPFEECENIMLKGFRTMLPALLIMILAWSIGTVCKSLGTAQYIVDLTKDWMTPAILPTLIFVIGMCIAFATGTSWGTMAILTPIGIPLAHTAGDMNLVYITIGAIFSGSIFGDHCSPISDTTVMSSIFAQSDHIAHVKTQIPYALTVAGVSAILFMLSSFITSGFVLLGLGIVLQFFIFRMLGSFYQQNKLSEEERRILSSSLKRETQ